MKIVLTDPAHLTPEAIEQFRELPATVHQEGVPTSPEQVVERLRGAHIGVTSYVRMGKAVLDQLSPDLRYLIAPASGHQGIDGAYAREQGVTVINTPTHNAQAVAEHTLGLMFSASRLIPAASQDLRSGGWRGGKFHGVELQGSRVAIISAGNIGRRVGAMTTGIGMETAYATSRSTPTEIDDLVAGSDVVCLTLPLTERTHHVMDKRRLGLMRDGAMVVNVSRGPVMDYEALYQEASTGRIIAGLDVFEHEPVVGDPNKTVDPSILALCNLPNVVGTPHMGWNTEQAAVRQGQELMANVQACLSGQPINVVN